MDGVSEQNRVLRIRGETEDGGSYIKPKFIIYTLHQVREVRVGRTCNMHEEDFINYLPVL